MLYILNNTCNSMLKVPLLFRDLASAFPCFSVPWELRWPLLAEDLQVFILRVNNITINIGFDLYISLCAINSIGEDCSRDFL